MVNLPQSKKANLENPKHESNDSIVVNLPQTNNELGRTSEKLANIAGVSINAYLTRRKEKKNIERDKICPMCGIRFHAKRKDSLYCSPACKQKAYRQNKNVTDKG